MRLAILRLENLVARSGVDEADRGAITPARNLPEPLAQSMGVNGCKGLGFGQDGVDLQHLGNMLPGSGVAADLDLALADGHLGDRPADHLQATRGADEPALKAGDDEDAVTLKRRQPQLVGGESVQDIQLVLPRPRLDQLVLVAGGTTMTCSLATAASSCSHACRGAPGASTMGPQAGGAAVSSRRSLAATRSRSFSISGLIPSRCSSAFSLPHSA